MPEWRYSEVQPQQMDLSVIIVNYNVKYFLEQCLYSVEAAANGLETETIVVDNNSVDGSHDMVSEKFPSVRLLRNDKNLGFSKACNQAIRLSRGKYILLLNPDTVIEEDTLIKCLEYMDRYSQTGTLGVKMIDGKGRFLPESKRSLPTPGVAFYKIFGLSRLFPRSRIFGRYNLGYLDMDRVHEVDVLTGAFMLLRRSALDDVGLLDEDFFMYGEDIDLSFRMKNAGYINIYFPETTIIHYKGESTKKGSLNYVLTFYQAMLIFARKHYSKRITRSWSLVIKLAIYFRALLSILRRFVRNFSLPAVQSALIFLGFFLLKPLWEQIRFGGDTHYPSEYLLFIVPSYILIWLLSLYLSGAYDRPARALSIFTGISLGTIIILVIYALLPESLRFSRALLLMGSVWALLSAYLAALLFHLLRVSAFSFVSRKNKKVIIVGNREEASRVESLLGKATSGLNVSGFVNPLNDGDQGFMGHIGQLEEIIQVNKIDEIIFCAADVSAEDIIRNMTSLQDGKAEYKIAPSEGLRVIGSSSINEAGDVYLMEFDTIALKSGKRFRRPFEIFTYLLIRGYNNLGRKGPKSDIKA